MIRAAILMLSAFVFMWGGRVTPVSLTQLQDAAQRRNDDTLYVVNFWATWCKPCVAEMPYFENAHAKFNGQKVKVIFVSLNSVKEIGLVNRFVKDKNVQSDVMLLNAGNPNSWIDKIETSWSGTIPATIMYRKGKKVFFREGEFQQQELDSIIQTKI